MTASALVMPLTTAHAGEVLAIRQAGIDEGNAAFETTAPAWEQFGPAQPSEHRSATLDETCRALGRVAVSKVSDRRAHAGVVEHSAHVHPSALGRSSAFSLPEAPVDPTAAAGIWTVRAGVFPESTTSLAVHDTTGIGIAGK